MRISLNIFALWAAIFVTSCQSVGETNSAPELNVIKKPGYSNKVLSSRKGNLLQKVYSGNTVIGYEFHHGTQVEYFAPNGRVFLWYPGNSSVVKGSVRVKGGGRFGNQICFTYQTNSYNPVTGHRGGTESCSELQLKRASIAESVRGDVFNLSSGSVPFVLSRKETKLQKLYNKHWKQNLRPAN